MGKTAYVFPGQGSQTVGMAQDVYNAHEEARHLFEQADDILGFQLSRIVFSGPEEVLRDTVHAQPALLTASLALYEVYRKNGIVPDFTAGHSLGEYTALVVSGVLSFEEAVRLVHLRGRYMQEAVPSGIGTMAAVLGADRAKLTLLCEEVSKQTGIVELANVNCPGQIVISGSQEGVKAATARIAESGAKRVIPLNVSGPFHSSLMQPAADQLAAALATATLAEASIPVIANVTARPVVAASDVRSLLQQQVVAPVLWEDSVTYLIEHEGVDTFIEIGPGNVLAGLIKKINRNVKIISVSDLGGMTSA